MVRRRIGEEFHPECVVPTVKFGGGSIMVWGSMATMGVGELFLCEGRMNSLTYTSMLKTVLEPSAKKIFQCQRRCRFVFQQDNAPCHTSKHSMDLKKKT